MPCSSEGRAGEEGGREKAWLVMSSKGAREDVEGEHEGRTVVLELACFEGDDMVERVIAREEKRREKGRGGPEGEWWLRRNGKPGGRTGRGPLARWRAAARLTDAFYFDGHPRVSEPDPERRGPGSHS